MMARMEKSDFILGQQMNIPSFWAVHTIEVPYEKRTGKDKALRKRNAKIRRYGWSDDSVEFAKQQAIDRCEEAKKVLLTTGSVKQVEPRGSYAVAGLPIREEVVQKYLDLNCVTTINVYGATCLNSEDVMILDIDNEDLQSAYVQKTYTTSNSAPKDFSLLWALLPPLLLMVSARISGTPIGGGLQIFIIGILVGFFVFLIFYINTRRFKKWFIEQGGPDGMLDSFILPFIDRYPQIVFNIYRTPLGYRLIELNNVYSSNDTTVQCCFDELPVDPQYAQLCQIQNCFRARVTAKPWNIKECEPRIPYRDFWADNSELREREEWLVHYHELAASYAACRFIKQVGTRPSAIADSGKAKTHDYIDDVVALHDELSLSRSALPVG